MQLTRVLLITSLAASAAVTQVTGEEILDLVKAARERKPLLPGTTLSGSGGLVGGSRIIRPQLPLEATLLSITPRNVPYGGDFTYEVALRNASETDFKIPWSAEPIDSVGIYPVVQALIHVEDAFNDRYFFGTMGFFGSSGSPDTIKTLRPGEQIVIRAGGSLKAFGLDESEAFISSLPRKLVLRARIVFISGGTADAALTFNTPLFRNPVPVISDNSVSVQVQGPRKP